MLSFEVRLTRAANRDLAALPKKVLPALQATITESIASNPMRNGKPLRGGFEGKHVARRGDYRIMYRIDLDQRVVFIERVRHRRDIYRIY